MKRVKMIEGVEIIREIGKFEYDSLVRYSIVEKIPISEDQWI